MKKLVLSIVTLFILQGAKAQSINKIIKPKEIKRIEQKLSSDDMEGRRAFTPGIAKASAFIEGEFTKIGLQTFNGALNYRQEFFVYQSTTDAAKVTINGNPIADSLVVSFS